jgi:adenylate cyclase
VSGRAGPPAAFDDEELARLSGTTVERVRRMTELHLLEPDEGMYRTRDIGRVRAAEALDAAGIELEQVGAMVDAGEYSMTWIDAVSPDPVPSSGKTLAEVAAELDIPLDLAHRIFTVAFQLSSPADDDVVREDDVESLRMLALVYELSGRDADMAIAASRYFGDNLRRLAESQTRFFRERFEDPLAASGLPHHDVMRLTVELAAPLIPLGFRAVELLFRRHFDHYAMEDVVANIEIALERAGRHRRRERRPPAIAFLDLSGYTQLTEERGDDEAAGLAERFAELVTHEAEHFGGRVVKLLGDGAMFHFADPPDAVRTALALVEMVPQAGLPTARVGLHVGPVVYRDGDYFGGTVNVASRVTDRAAPGEVLLTADAASAAGAPDLAFDEVGKVSLKGVTEPIVLVRARRG